VAQDRVHVRRFDLQLLEALLIERQELLKGVDTVVAERG
jgi:hypothetical protein